MSAAISFSPGAGQLRCGSRVRGVPQGGGGAFALLATRGLNAGSHTDDTVTSGLMHRYYVRAANAQGDSKPPNEVAILASDIGDVNPDVTITTGESSPTNASPSAIAVTFSQPVAGFGTSGWVTWTGRFCYDVAYGGSDICMIGSDSGNQWRIERRGAGLAVHRRLSGAFVQLLGPD